MTDRDIFDIVKHDSADIAGHAFLTFLVQVEAMELSELERLSRWFSAMIPLHDADDECLEQDLMYKARNLVEMTAADKRLGYK